MSDREYLQPAGVASPPEPYSHVIRVGKTVYIAGQVAFDAGNKVVGRGDPRLQAEQCWKNIEACVRAAGGTVTDIVKVVCFLKDIRHVPYEIAVRRRLFPEGRWPAYTMVQVANLGQEDLLYEIDVTAVLP
ncbi:MAG: RidA family protein [Chloroflexi bacterium]|nr:MAG: RidA family protein [Chloroflexota bacterium]